MTGTDELAIRAILAVPLAAALLLAALPGYRLTARLNVLAALATFAAALALLAGERPPPGPYLIVDDLNIVFIVLGTLVGFTTSAFSASYIQHELDTGRLAPVHLRFYHAMYQALMFAMNLALLANNATLSSSPDSTAEIGVGPSACASGSQACNGTRPTLVP